MSDDLKSRSLLLALVIASPAALAWDGSVSGRIAQADVTSAGNLAFRVVLESSPAMCGNANAWAYVDTTDANYNAYVAVLLAAKAQNVLIHVYSNRDAQGYCKIGYVATYAS